MGFEIDEEEKLMSKPRLDNRRPTSIKTNIRIVSIFLISFLVLIPNANSQRICSNGTDFFDDLNKYDPEFDLISYITPSIRVDKTSESNLIQFKVTDKDYLLKSLGSIRLFTLRVNDSNFNILPDFNNNRFSLNFNGKLNYNINNAHRYVVEMVACDQGLPVRCGKALVYVPLINYNVNPPSFTDPTILVAAITFKKGEQLGYLNAWDIDGDKVTFSLDVSNSQLIKNTIQVESDGRVLLKDSLTSFAQSFTFLVQLNDDGSSCLSSGPNTPVITKSTKMTVLLEIIEVNMHSPIFIPYQNENYCEKTFKAPENSKFRIYISAKDDDNRGQNGAIQFLSPDITDRSPQNSFSIQTMPQSNRNLNGYVYNMEEFDYENPKYGSNIMNIMVIAEDKGSIRRRGYCFMTIEITDVNDNVPVFAQRSYTIYVHAQYKTRQFYYRFVAVDKDSGENGTVQYFMDPNNSQLARDLFNLDLNGNLTIKDKTLLDSLNTPLEFRIYAEDKSVYRNRSDYVTVKIIKTSLKLLPPFFSDFPQQSEISDVSEMTPRGSLLRNFEILIQTNPDEQFLRCFLSPKPNPEWFKFEFPNPNRGLNQKEQCSLRIEDPLNYRLARSMIVYIVAEVGNYLMSSTARELKILTINLKEENINPPKFVTNTIEASVVEGSDDLGKVIAIVKAYDLDLTPLYNTITYELDPVSNKDQHFSIDSKTGEIKLIKVIQDKKNIPLEVYARDGANGYNMNAPNQNSIYVDVKVIDINDNQPVFGEAEYKFDVPEDAQPGYVIGRVEVSDKDIESYFNYSLNDATFGIRDISSQTKSKTSNNYKGSAEIYLNNYLDFNRRPVYDILAFVSDSFYVVSVRVVINVINVNDRPPEFTGTPYSVTIDEESIPNRPLITLTAKDDDNLNNNNFIYELYSTPYLDKNWFKLDPQTGVLTLLKGLDRDAPNGMKTMYLPVSVSDQGNPNLKSYTTVSITLNDINDNAPYLAYGSNIPLIIDEKKNSGQVELYVIDVDEPKYGPPFTFTLENYTNEFSIQQVNCLDCPPDRLKYQLVNLKQLDRNSQKYYSISYKVSDNGGVSRTGVLQLVVGDIDNNPQSDGSKQIKILSFEKNIQPNFFLGTLYVQDKDDWDLVTKKSSNCEQSTRNTFDVRLGLQIFGPMSFTDFPKDYMNLQCTVTDQSSQSALARVDFTVDNVQYADMIDLVGLRLLGTTAEEFTKKLTISEQNGLERLLIKLVNILSLNQQTDLLKVITIRNFVTPQTQVVSKQIPNYDLNSFGVDLYFYVRKSNRLVSSRKIYDLINSNLNSILANNQDFVGLKLLFDLCPSQPLDYCPVNSYCKQNFVTSQQALTIDANATSFVGLNNQLSTHCYCNLEVTQPVCHNGGTVVSSSGGSDYYCNCPDGYEGPRCEFLSITFNFTPSSSAHSYALFKNIEPCDPTRIEFEFITERSKGLLLFNGPTNRDSLYFIAVEIFNKELLVHIGTTNISFPGINVSDKKWHKVDISWSLNSVQIDLDRCNSKTAELNNYEEMIKDKQPNDNFKLSLGGIPPEISTNHYYYNQLNVFEYEGCIRNLRVNGDLRNLKLVQGQNNLAQNLQQCDCVYLSNCDSIKAPRVTTPEFPWWIILVILGALACLALILGLAVCTIRRKDSQKKMLQMFPDDDIRETIINYADGAGEENTENFNIGVIKKPVGPIVQAVNTGNYVVNVNQQSRIVDLPTNDQNMFYAYEGDGSECGSLSSVCSINSDKDHDFEYLKDWGPKFVKLSSIYTKNNDPNFHVDYQNHGFEFSDGTR